MQPKWISRCLEPGEIVLHVARPSRLRTLIAIAYFGLLLGPVWIIFEVNFGSEGLRPAIVTVMSMVLVCAIGFNYSRIALTNRRLLHWDPITSFDETASYDLEAIRSVQVSRMVVLRSVHFDVRGGKRFGIFGIKDAGALSGRLRSMLAADVPITNDPLFNGKAVCAAGTPLLAWCYGTLWTSCAAIAWLWPLVTDDGACGIVGCLAAGLLMLPVIAASLGLCFYLALPLGLTLWRPFLTTTERRAIAGEFWLLSDSEVDDPARRGTAYWNLGMRYVNWLCGGPIDRPVAENEELSTAD